MKKIFSLLLALVLVIGVTPTVMAGGNSETIAVPGSSQNRNVTLGFSDNPIQANITWTDFSYTLTERWDTGTSSYSYSFVIDADKGKVTVANNSGETIYATFDWTESTLIESALQTLINGSFSYAYTNSAAVVNAETFPNVASMPDGSTCVATLGFSGTTGIAAASRYTKVGLFGEGNETVTIGTVGITFSKDAPVQP